jgi:DNA-binding response OmpR family regulator
MDEKGHETGAWDCAYNTEYVLNSCPVSGNIHLDCYDIRCSVRAPFPGKALLQIPGAGSIKRVDMDGSVFPRDAASVSSSAAIAELEDQPRRSKITREPGNAPGRRILIVDDDVTLAGFLSAELQAQGFGVDVVHDGEAAFIALAGKTRYHLMILDLNLPKLDGCVLIERLRPAHPRLPIMVLSARSRVEDKVAAFHSGADDCLTKPFSLLELQARAHALMRRNSGAVPNSSKVGDLELHREERRVERNGRRIDLTPREFAILDVMMRNAGRPVSRATLLDEVWNTSAEPSTNIVDVYMKYVRDKVDFPGEPRLTHTIRGFGYELREA